MPEQSSHKSTNITKCDHLGTPQICYPGQVVYADEHVMVARCLWRLQKTYRLGSFFITEGDILLEFYYFKHWFNIFCVYNPAGQLKGWYCNITYPVAPQPHQISWHDLALDLLVLPNGQRQVLDRDEFAALPLSDQDRVQAQAAMRTLEQWATMHRGPFAQANNTGRSAQKRGTS